MKKIILISLFLSGCGLLVPDYERPAVDSPDWRGADANRTPTEIPQDWWKKFGSEEMNELVDKSLANNTDLNAAVARIKQAEAGADISEAGLFPTIGLSGNLNHTKRSQSDDNRTIRSYQASVPVSYQVDLFGANWNNSRSSDERLTGTVFEHDAVALVTSSETARIYAQYLSITDRLLLAIDNLEIEKQVMKIVQARYDAGKISGLELAQQRTALSNTLASIASFIENQDNLRNQLAVLNGVPPQSFTIKAQTLNGFQIPSILPSQPAELLGRRPDIRKSESDLIAANIDIGQARAAYFPSLRVGLEPVVSASPLGAQAVLNTTLAESVSQTIFDGGAIFANVDRLKARKLELIEVYKGQVLNAFREVQNALAAVKAADTRLINLNNAVISAQKAYEISKEQYKDGAIEFQNLLETQRALFNAQDSFAQTQYDRVAAAIDLYKTLGGGWQENK